MIKIEENEVLNLLNDDLRNNVTIHLKGRIIRNCELFDNFKIEFVSQLVFLLNLKRYSVGDSIIFEKETGDEIYFIENGKVALLHQSSHTYILDLQVIGFGLIWFREMNTLERLHSLQTCLEHAPPRVETLLMY